MLLKSSLKCRKILPFALLLFILAFTSTSMALQNDAKPKAGFNPPNSLDHYRFVVKLKADLAAQAESSLGLTDMDIQSASPKNMAAFFQKYKLKRMAPVYKNLIRWKKQTGKSEKDFIAQIKGKYSRRAGHYRGTSAPPEVSRTYVFEPNVNNKQEFDKMLNLLRKDPGIEYAEADRVVTVQMVPNDPYFSSGGSWGQSFDDLYGLKKINCPGAWDLATGSGIIVAVVDTGIDKNHPDIAANVWSNTREIPNNGIDDDDNGYIDDCWGWNFVNNTNGSIDDYGHGTHVAGTIAAVGNNGTGVIGVAPNAKVMDLKAFDKREGYDSWIAAAIHYAADNGADIINCSFGGPGSSSALEEAIDYAYSLGIVVVAAAGNEHSDVKDFHPGGYHNVITVSALDNSSSLAFFSNFGTEIDVAAPGVDILSLRATGTTMGTPLGDYYTRADGTSMAAPHVSGLAALILSRHSEFSNEQVRQVVRTSADDLFATGIDRESGFGQANALKAASMDNVLEAYMDDVASGNALTGCVPVTGTVKGLDFSSYTLEYGAGYTPSIWNFISQGSSPVDKSQLGVFDATVIPDGIYTLRLTVKDNSVPQKIYTDYLEINVDYTDISDPVVPSVPVLAKVFKPGKIVPINGTATGPSFQHFRLEWAEGLNPSEWSNTGFTLVNTGYSPVTNGLLGNWDSSVFPGRAGYYQIRLLVENAGFTSEARTTIYLEPDLFSDNWPQKLNTYPPFSVLPAKDISGTSSLVLSLPDVLSYPYPPSFCRFSYDGVLQNSVSFNYGFLHQLAVANLDGSPGEEVVFTRDSNYIRIVKPDNSFVEFSPDNTNRYNFQQTPMILQDLNGDAAPEILAVGNDHQNNDTKFLFAWNTQGTLVSDNFPLPVLDKEDVSLKPKVRFLAVDLDGDAKKEIIVVHGDTNGSSSLKLYSWDGLPRNWPVQPLFLNSLIMDMAAGDLDGDGQIEIVLSTVETIPTASGRVSCGDTKIYLLAADGSVKEGWPFTISQTTTMNTPSVDIGIADMDRDGNDEIVVSGINYVYVLQLNGTLLSSRWPYRVSFLRKFSIGDINGDTFPEIVIVQCKPVDTFISDYDIIALDKDGVKIRSWKMLGIDEEGPDLYNTEPVLGDFDNNGKVDIAISYGLDVGSMIVHGALTVLALNADYDPDYMDWPMISHDPQNTSVRISTSTKPVITGISLDASNYSVAAGMTRDVSVTGIYSDGSNKDFTNSSIYQIGNSNIATVDATGKIKGVSPGITTLTVNFGSITASAQIIVEAPVLIEICPDFSSYEMPVGLTKNVNVNAIYSDNSIQNVTNAASYQISDMEIAVIDSAGMIKGLTCGTTTLSVSYGGQTVLAGIVVTEPVITAIALDASSYMIPIGLTQNVTVTATYSDNSRKNVTNSVTYSISNPSIASVDTSGTMKGLANGVTTLTVKSNGFTASAQVYALPPVVTAINLNASTYTIQKNEQLCVIVTGTYSDGSTKNVTANSSYQTSDPGIVKVYQTGKIEGVAPGTATLTVSMSGKTTTAQVVVEAPVLSIRLDSSSYGLPAGLTTNVTVTAVYSDNSTKDVTDSASYQIVNSNIAIVDSTGMITGKQEGTTTINVSYQGKTATAPVIISQPVVTAISLDAPSYSMPAGITMNVAVTATYSDNSSRDVTSSASYQIANNNIASADSTGRITGLLQGETTLTVSYQDKTATAPVNVGPPYLTGIRLNESTYTMPVGLTQNVVVTAIYSDNHTEDVTNSATYQVDWTVIATVDATGLITGRASGNMNLTVTYQGKTATAGIWITMPVITRIAFGSSEYAVLEGTTANVSVLGYYSDGRVVDVTLSSSYQFSESQIASINGYGIVAGIQPGTVTLTARRLDLTATTQVIVKAP